MQPSYETDLSKLERFIKLSEKPLNARWQTFQMTGKTTSELGPTDWNLVAILEYDPGTLQKLKDSMEVLTTPAETFVEANFVKDWFPQAVRDSFVSDPATGYLKLSPTRYKPTLFAQAPLQFGYVFFADSALFIYLHTV
jgi:hypothetical protein